MTQLGESIAVAAMQQSGDDECWFCEEEPEDAIQNNSEDASPDTSDNEPEDEVPENDDKNNSGALGENLGDRPTWSIICPDKNQSTDIVPGAHHCIPGKAAFKKVMDLGLKDFVSKKGDNSFISDIGYSINHANNGIWLPGNYGVRKGKGHYTKTWKGYENDVNNFQQEYVNRAIKATNRQFHDAHAEYNKLVKKTLENILEELGEPENECPICHKPYDKTRPPYGLVGRLDFVSMSYKRVLDNLGKKKGRKWQHIQSGCRTSDKVLNFYTRAGD